MNREIEEMAKNIEICDGEITTLCHNVKCKECRYFFNKEDCYMLRLSEMLVAKGYRKSADVAREIFAEIEREIELALESNYKAEKQNRAIDRLYMHATIMGKITALRGIGDFITELKKKYESEVAE